MYREQIKSTAVESYILCFGESTGHLSSVNATE